MRQKQAFDSGSGRVGLALVKYSPTAKASRKRTVREENMDVATPSEEQHDADQGLDIDPEELAQSDRYKLLCGLVIPRPIALVTTLSESGVVNAAPFSFFNIFSEEPPVVALGLNSRADGSTKDTTRNINASGEFVVHLVSDEIAEKMCICAVDFPEDLSEIDMAGFTLKPSHAVSPPTIVEAPVALECRLISIAALSPTRDLALGKIVRIRTQPGLVSPDRLHVDIERYRPVGRLMGNLYVHMGEVFEMKRLTYKEWLGRQDGRQEKIR